MNRAIIKQRNSCILYYQNHAVFKCRVFNSKPVVERWKVAKINNLCQNCLHRNHKLENSHINFGYKNCSERYHTRLDVYTSNQTSGRVNNITPDYLVSKSAQSCLSNVFLPFSLIKVKGSKGKFMQCRALIDNTSQNSPIPKKCAKHLNLLLSSTSHSLRDKLYGSRNFKSN